MSKPIVEITSDDWTGWTFKSKKDLKNFLQEQSAQSSNFDTEEEYLKENAHVTLDEYCDLFEIEYKEVSK